jgi:hypothetical protein
LLLTLVVDGAQTVSRRTKKIQEGYPGADQGDVGVRHHRDLIFTLLIAHSDGTEEGRQISILRRFPALEFHH